MGRDVHVTVYDRNDDSNLGCFGVAVGVAIAIFLVVSAIAAVFTLLMELLVQVLGIIFFVVAIIFAIILGIIALIRSIPTWYALFLFARSIVFTIRDSVKYNALNRSETCSKFVNFIRRFFGFIKDFVVYYCKHNAVAVRDCYQSMLNPQENLLARVFFFFAMLDVVFIAYVCPFLVPILLCTGAIGAIVGAASFLITQIGSMFELWLM